eukprot:CAMPEP_0194266766 /NCGR_PEP_ID=MMETSP0169-20130528/1562_1 /TAXON_ID=218684 /ORGANISM="Corethron pennatum, Strain L29A3" /LENGTH=237 /DNA_ID=CAMNT_0039007525 /DNA_START=43 /DNA_END=756 /DNA_ORIENTATION=+
MKFGQKGKELLLDLKRSSQQDHNQSGPDAAAGIPAYNAEAVRACIDECTHHYTELEGLVAATSSGAGRERGGDGDDIDAADGRTGRQRLEFSSRPALLFHDACLNRNRRCLLAYHRHRADRLRDVRWEGAGGGAMGLPDAIRTNLADAEVEFFSKYDSLLSSYCAKINFDLTSSLAPPDHCYLVEIRVISPDVGTIITEDGSEINLEMGTIHYLQYSEVEHLVRQGLVEMLNTEDNI